MYSSIACNDWTDGCKYKPSAYNRSSDGGSYASFAKTALLPTVLSVGLLVRFLDLLQQHTITIIKKITMTKDDSPTANPIVKTGRRDEYFRQAY